LGKAVLHESYLQCKQFQLVYSMLFRSAVFQVLSKCFLGKGGSVLKKNYGPMLKAWLSLSIHIIQYWLIDFFYTWHINIS